MVLLFGISWPLSIYKSYKTRSAKGKSLFFLFAIFAGYICGIAHKIINGWNYAAYFYVLNMVMVGVDICLYFRNSAIDKKNAK